jgi:hypothetical protein
VVLDKFPNTVLNGGAKISKCFLGNLFLFCSDDNFSNKATGWRVAAILLNEQSRTVDKRWSSSLRVGQGANNSSCYEMLHSTSKVGFSEHGNEPSGSIIVGKFD